MEWHRTMIQNFGRDGLSHYGVWFELHQADFLWFELRQVDLPHGLRVWGWFELYQANFPYYLSYTKRIFYMV